MRGGGEREGSESLLDGDLSKYSPIHVCLAHPSSGVGLLRNSSHPVSCEPQRHTTKHHNGEGLCVCCERHVYLFGRDVHFDSRWRSVYHPSEVDSQIMLESWKKMMCRRYHCWGR